MKCFQKICIKTSRDNDHKNKPKNIFSGLLFVFEVLKSNLNIKTVEIEKILISKVF